MITLQSMRAEFELADAKQPAQDDLPFAYFLLRMGPIAMSSWSHCSLPHHVDGCHVIPQGTPYTDSVGVEIMYRGFERAFMTRSGTLHRQDEMVRLGSEINEALRRAQR